MRSLFIKWLFFLITMLALGWLFLPQQSVDNKKQKSTSNDILPEENSLYAKVLKPRAFVFPHDHGPHPSHRIEWWYFTGNLHTETRRKFGYELTFFRFALTPEQAKSQSNWRSNQMYMAHFALTDVDNKKFYTDERFSRAGNGLAGAKTDKYHVWLYDWKAEADDEVSSAIQLSAKADDFAIALRLNSEKNIALQGLDGFSKKSAKPGNASYYYSYTRMMTSGDLRINQHTYSVTGSSWMDREWTSASLSAQQVGWDWFALQLSDQSDLMFYRFRRKDENQDQHNAGAIFDADNAKKSLSYSDVEITVLEYWKSPHSNISYPSKWLLTVPSQKLELLITPLINDQELNLTYRYWEGAVSITGKKNGRSISGRGYVELTGY